MSVSAGPSDSSSAPEFVVPVTSRVSGVARAPGRMVDRMLIAFGRRDHHAEAAAIGMALRGCTEAQVAGLVDQLMDLAGSPAAADALGFAARAYDRIDPAKQQRLIATGHGAAAGKKAKARSGGAEGDRGVGEGLGGAVDGEGWGAALAQGLTDAYPDEQAAIARLIGETLAPDALPHLCTLIANELDLVAEIAGRALIQAAHRANRPPQLDELTRQSIEACIVRCAQDFPEHRRKEALYALLMFLSTPAAWAASGAELRTFLKDHEHPAVLALRSIIKKDADPLSRRAALQWLPYEPLRAAAIDRLFQHAHVDGQQAVLGGAHLFANPARAAAISRAANRERPESSLTPEPAHLEHISLDAARGAISTASRWAADELPALAEAALGDHRPAVRLRAVTALHAAADVPARAERVGEPALREHAIDLLSDYTLDANPAVARAAFLALARNSRASARRLSILARSAHADLRTLASLAPAADSPLEIRARLAADRAAFVRDLQKHIIVGSSVSRIAAIRLAQRLGLASEMELELLTILQRAADLHAAAAADERARDEQRVAASAVAALAELFSPASQLAVQRALHHPDDRVRANAIDGLTRFARRRAQLTRESPVLAMIIEHKHDPRHRVRAGALRAELLATLRDPATRETGGTRDTGAPIIRALTPLITDDRPLHRLSGLWLAERLAPELGIGWKDTGATQALSGAVNELAQTDPDPQVRTRAVRTARGLQARLRAGWGDAPIPA